MDNNYIFLAPEQYLAGKVEQWYRTKAGLLAGYVGITFPQMQSLREMFADDRNAPHFGRCRAVILVREGEQVYGDWAPTTAAALHVLQQLVGSIHAPAG